MRGGERLGMRLRWEQGAKQADSLSVRWKYVYAESRILDGDLNFVKNYSLKKRKSLDEFW